MPGPDWGQTTASVKPGPAHVVVVAEDLHDDGALGDLGINRLGLHGKVRPFRAAAPGQLALSPGPIWLLVAGEHTRNRTLLVLDVIGCIAEDQSVEAKVIVGKNIRANRRRLKLTQEDLAERADMHAVEIGRAERGVRDLRVSTIVKLAHGLNIPAGELLRGL